MSDRPAAASRGDPSSEKATASPSARLGGLREQALAGPTSLGDLSDRLGSAATGTLLLLCGLAGLMPGVAVALGVPLCLLGIGLLLGRRDAWLPGRVRGWKIPRDRLVTAIDRLTPRLRWLERHLLPRALWATGPAGCRAIGAAAIICGILIILPVPFGNTAPAVAVIILAVGLLVRDGLAVLAGLGFAAGALALDAVLLAVGYDTVLRLTDLFS